MGFRFRRSVKIAPGVKLNFGKKSTSVSFGGKGAHYTISSTGRKTATVGIPGTGISYSSTQSGNSSSGGKSYAGGGGGSGGTGQRGGAGGCLIGSIKILFAILFFPFVLSYLFWKSDKIPLGKAGKAGVLAIVWIILLVFAGSGSDEATPYPSSAVSSTVSSVMEQEPTPEPTAEPTPEPTATPEPGPTATPAPEMVWIPTNGGTKYHSRSDCSGMEDPEYVTKETAIARGFGPCGRCY